MFDDEFNGQGGTFIVDPVTGKRSRVPEDGEVSPAVQTTTKPTSRKATAAPVDAPVDAPTTTSTGV